jgi:hypothetical protein
MRTGQRPRHDPRHSLRLHGRSNPGGAGECRSGQDQCQPKVDHDRYRFLRNRVHRPRDLHITVTAPGFVRHQAGLPLVITASGCNDPNGGTCMPNLNPNFASHQWRLWTQGACDRNDGYSIYRLGCILSYCCLHHRQFTTHICLWASWPGNYDESVSLRRAFKIYEQLKFIFEASAFNLDNHVDPGSPNVSFSTPVANSSADARFSSPHGSTSKP